MEKWGVNRKKSEGLDKGGYPPGNSQLGAGGGGQELYAAED